MNDMLFGTLMIGSVFLGCELAYLRGKKTGLNIRYLVDSCLFAIFAGFALSHLVTVVVYHPDILVKDPASLLMVWGGMSAFGGFLGGIAGICTYLWRKKEPFLPYCEAILFGFVPVWILGRLGCTLTFDHPGTPTGFFLGMADSSGIVRHNLGFYEMLWTVVITIVLYSLRNYMPFRGFHSALVIFLYAPVRFCLDYLRIADPVYFGMTPGQYFSIALFLFGIYLLVSGLTFKKLPENLQGI
jgi:phosphatidylglycerol:prolipoprotein diacylglycerol transferase